ncbi:TetR/AcrR family transcriptional regulator [Actinomadura kijaniata]|uniref:TetR/AcrR family transcriptional regulator n=1 Tax=Actinomadura kijaniata TaxID=46161 RepID=UPI000834C871|nr:TetR/AcrR family transcriptional regulator [Actinomadura kijaniata]
MARPRTTSDEEILEAATRAVWRHGVGGLTLAAVAREAGLAPATLVQRFGSKRGLLLALARRSSDPFGKAREGHGSPLAALHAALEAMVADVRTPAELANSMSFLQLDLTDEEFHGHAAEGARRMRRRIADLVAEAVAAGELAEGTDAGRLARTVQVTYNGTLIVWALTQEGEPLAPVLRAAVDEVLRPYRVEP